MYTKESIINFLDNNKHIRGSCGIIIHGINISECDLFDIITSDSFIVSMDDSQFHYDSYAVIVKKYGSKVKHLP